MIASKSVVCDEDNDRERAPLFFLLSTVLGLGSGALEVDWLGAALALPWKLAAFGAGGAGDATGAAVGVEVAERVTTVDAVGATSTVLSKTPPLDCASCTACWSRVSAFCGTCDTKPMRGGSTEGWVRLP
jgi:hypothetical protein